MCTFTGFLFQHQRRSHLLLGEATSWVIAFPQRLGLVKAAGFSAARQWQWLRRHRGGRGCEVLDLGARRYSHLSLCLRTGSHLHHFPEREISYSDHVHCGIGRRSPYWERKKCLKPAVLYSGAPPAGSVWLVSIASSSLQMFLFPLPGSHKHPLLADPWICTD